MNNSTVSAASHVAYKNIPFLIDCSENYDSYKAFNKIYLEIFYI